MSNLVFIANVSTDQRCKVTLARAQQIETLWRAAFTAAGAGAVDFTTDGPQLAAASAAGGAV